MLDNMRHALNHYILPLDVSAMHQHFAVDYSCHAFQRQQSACVMQYVEESAAGTRYQPGRRHPDFMLDEKAPFVYSKRY